jgi:hypothetical protein
MKNKKKSGATTALTGGTPVTETGGYFHRDRRLCQSKAVTTLPGDQIGYVQPLQLGLGHSDHTLEQVWRDKTHVVYRHFGSHGQFIGWEAILIKVAPARRVFGKDYPQREVYPSNEDFGQYALSVGPQYDLDYAILKAKTLKLKISPGEPATKPIWKQAGNTLQQHPDTTPTETCCHTPLKPNEVIQIIHPRRSLPVES